MPPPTVVGGGVENAFIAPCHTPPLWEPRARSHLPAPGAQPHSGGSTLMLPGGVSLLQHVLVFSLKLNSDLSLILRYDAGLTVILPQSLSPDSCTQ